MAGVENPPSHRKGDSFHRRRTFEINNAGAFDDIGDGAAEQQPKHLAPQPAYPAYSNHDRSKPDYVIFDDKRMDISVGMQVKVRDVPGLAMVLWMGGDMIGVELEQEVGNSDGVYKGERKFTVNKKCALFIAKERVDRLYHPMPAPRFRSRCRFNVGDVAMINSQIGVGVVRYASSELIGCSLNEAVGNSDGTYDGHRYFQVKKNHAFFTHPKTCKKIEAEDLLNKLNDTVVRLQALESDLKKFQS